MRFAYLNKDEQNTLALYNKLADARKAKKLVGDDYIAVRGIDRYTRAFLGYVVVNRFDCPTEEV